MKSEYGVEYYHQQKFRNFIITVLDCLILSVPPTAAPAHQTEIVVLGTVILIGILQPSIAMQLLQAV